MTPIKNNTTRSLYVLAAAALIAVLAFFMVQTRSVDFDAHYEILGSLRELKQVDAEWNVDVLRAKIGLNTHYDRVAIPLTLIDSLKLKLVSKGDLRWRERADSHERLVRLLDVFNSLMDKKIVLIERFKSQNAILRNSSRFLPVAATDLIEATLTSGAAASAQANIERALNNLLADTMTYSIAPDEALRDRIDLETRQLIGLTAPLPAAVGERAATLVAHAGTVVKQQARGTEILAELSALPTAKAIDELSDAHAQETEKMLVGQQIYRKALVAYSIFLLLLLGYAAWRLFVNYRLLGQTNSVLRHTNSELKESQAHLVQAEKMSALGQMVAGIAHEINTPLAYVKGTFSVLKDQLAPMEDLANRSYRFTRLMHTPEHDKAAVNVQLCGLRASAESVVEGQMLQEMGGLLKDGIHGIEQISEIVLNLKNFSRLDRAKVGDFSVSAGLDSTLLLANHLLKDRVEIRKDYGAVPNISGSPSQINQVFLNIITNAVHAMAERTTPNVITLRTAQEDRRTVRVEIRDNGKGIPKDVLAKIFDPFFTTKPVGQGTGMGLSISFKIIQEHGGRLLVDSEEGVGTVFTILLPIKSVLARTETIAADELLVAG